MSPKSVKQVMGVVDLVDGIMSSTPEERYLSKAALRQKSTVAWAGARSDEPIL